MKINILLFGACLLIMAIACTVNKRAHRPGYNVEWHSANPKPRKHSKLVEQEKANDVPSSEIKGIDVSASLYEEGMIINNEFGNSGEPIGSGSPIAGISIAPIRENHKSSSDSSISMEYQEDLVQIVPKEKSRPDRLAITGFWLVMLGILVLLTSALLGVIFFMSLPMILVYILYAEFIMATIVGFLLCTVSLVKMKRNPDNYQNKGLAVAGFIIGALIVSLLLLALFLTVF